MATRNRAETTSTTAMSLPLSKIREAARNVHLRERRGDETFKGLVDSIRANGIIHRIVVRPDADGGGYVIVDGHRRFKAAQAAGMPEVPVEVRDVGEDAALAVTIAANVQRLDDDPILEAEAVERMEKGGMSREEIAAAIGKSVACVARRARLASLSRPWREFARRVPCTTDLLEKVAAHETQLQERVAADIGLDEYEYDGEGGERCPWGEFENTFDRAVMKISDAAFDASVCANCPNNTARHAYLFDFMASEDGDDARCQDPACYAKRNNAAVDALVERLRRGGTPAVEVADRWRIPEYWNASAKPGAKHRQAYVYTDGSLKRVRWSVPMPKPERAQSAMTDEEREAARRVKRAHNEWKKNRLAAYEKVRSALGDVETRRGFFRSVVRTEEFCDWAENYLERQAGSTDYIYDGFCQEMLRMANAKTLADWNVELTDEEIGAVTSEDPAIARDGEGGAESGE